MKKMLLLCTLTILCPVSIYTHAVKQQTLEKRQKEEHRDRVLQWVSLQQQKSQCAVLWTTK